ncbi:MAG: SBBP repeat-containing protein [Promethearchaeota archaeon]
MKSLRIKILFSLFIFLLICGIINEKVKTSEDSLYYEKNEIIPVSSAMPEAVVDWSVIWGSGDVLIWDEGYDVIVDANDNVFVAGSTQSIGKGVTDMVLVKYNRLGVEQWNSTWGWNDIEEARSLAVDSSGNIYLIGYTDSFGAGDDDICLVKFDSMGVLIWNVTWGGSLEDQGFGIIIDSMDNIFVAGNTFSYGPGGRDLCLIKYNTDGIQQWNKTWGGTGYDTGVDFLMDSKGNFFVCGSTVSFGITETDILLVKFNNVGDFQWYTTWNEASNNYEFGDSLALDFSENIILAGYSTSTYRLLLFKISPSGSEIWRRSWIGSGLNEASEIYVDSSNNIICGMTFSDGSDNYNNFSLFKFDSNGEYHWNVVWEGGRREECSGLAIDSEENFYLAGTSGGFSDGSMCLIRINNTMPRIIINTPKSYELFNNTSPDFDISIYSIPNLDKTWYSINAGLENHTFTGLSGKINQSNWDNCPDGYITIEFYANTTTSNITTTKINVIKDTSGPTINIVSPGPYSFYNHDPPSFIVEINDIFLDKMWYNLNNSEKIFFTINNTINQENWLLLDDGLVNISFYANDTNGYENSKFVLVYKDTTMPTIQVISPSGGELFGLAAPSFTVRINDTNLDQMWYSLNGGLNQTFITNTTFRQDWWSNLPNGTVFIRFYANDTLGNEAMSLIIARIDAYIPSVSIINPIANQTFGVTAPNFIVRINETYLDQMWYTLNGGMRIPFLSNGTIDQNNWTALNDGYITIRFYANDTAGNMNFSEVIVMKDTTMPTIQVISPSGGELFGLAAPSFTVRINDTNLDQMWYSLNGGLNQTFITNTTFRQDWWSNLPNGTVFIRFYANDTLGNEAMSLIIARIDAYIPSVSIINPIANQTFGVTAPNFIVRINETYLDQMWYTLNGGMRIPFLSNGTIDQNNWTALNDGYITIRFYANDTAGNMNFSETIVLKDTNPPLIEIINPAEFERFGRIAPTFDLSVFDYSLDRIWYITNFSTETFYFTLTSGSINQTLWDGISDKSHILITFFANDSLSLINQTSIVLIKDLSIDQQPFDFLKFLTNPITLTVIIGVSVAVIGVIILVRRKGKYKSRSKEIERIQKLWNNENT